ncbi:hypothetical protein IE81DRAFT_250176 [Ceraceosorus guamensis]|uniref:Uncharacterized protein n=1 Tax=Ceraceosorus guamensis TaxID=1522189 RepID=A0A316VQH8_9BASI|nr:hypothetical protein IE81DRAFT_250176 [Ceraceosorus guamensis]PWN39899.1 hypothetical protein IE81DRAFT_250176 [Ceraceosorus guamensis]
MQRIGRCKGQSKVHDFGSPVATVTPRITPKGRPQCFENRRRSVQGARALALDSEKRETLALATFFFFGQAIQTLCSATLQKSAGKSCSCMPFSGVPCQ